MSFELEVKNVSHQYDGKTVLNDISLALGQGEIYSLLGTTGVGKSLLMRLISSVEQVQVGSIEKRNKKISFVFQNQSFIPWLTIRESFKLTQVNWNSEFKETLEKFKLETFLDNYPGELSGGTLQKLSLLRSFLDKNTLVLLDEPFSHIDYVQKYELYAFMIELWKKYKPAILMVTHDIEEALLLSHRVSFISSKEKNIFYTLETDNNLEEINFKKIEDIKWINVKREKFMSLYNYMQEDAKR